MRAAEFWKAVTVDRSNVLERFFETLRGHDVRFCLIGGQALNAYVEPVVSLDLDVVVASEQIAQMESLLRGTFDIEGFPHSPNVSARVAAGGAVRGTIIVQERDVCLSTARRSNPGVR